MSATPLPMPCPQVHEPDLVERDLDCSHYDDCLDRAVRERWAGFSCGRCPLRGRARAGELRSEAWLGSRDGGNLETASRQGGGGRATVRPESRMKGGFYLEVFEFFGEQPEWTTADLALRLGIRADKIASALKHLTNRGLVRRIAAGRFVKAIPGEMAAPPPPPPVPLETRVREVIDSAAAALTAPQVAEVLKESQVQRVAKALCNLAQDGAVRRSGRGLFVRVSP